MLRALVASLFLAAAGSAAAAQNPNDYEKSILFKDRSNPHAHLNHRGADSHDAHCRDLSRQIAEHKYAFQRKSALTRRYEAECKTHNGPRERSSLKESNRLQP